MDDAARMGSVERASHLDAEHACLLGPEAVAAVEAVAQRASGHDLHHEEWRVAFKPKIEHPYDVRMRERGDRACLVQKARFETIIERGETYRPQRLDGDVTREQLIARKKYIAHPARAERPYDLVSSEAATGGAVIPVEKVTHGVTWILSRDALPSRRIERVGFCSTTSLATTYVTR